MKRITNQDYQSNKKRHTNHLFEIGSAHSKGKKQYMEDQHIVLENFNECESENNQNSIINRDKYRVAYCGVYDGHGGDFSCLYLKKHLHKRIHKLLNDILLNPPPEVNNDQKKLQFDIRKMFMKAYNEIDTELIKSQDPSHDSGACAISLLIVNNSCYVSNVGDCKAILIRAIDFKDVQQKQKIHSYREKYKAIMVSHIHTPFANVTERERITNQGGFIGEDGRVCGSLIVSRSFGDSRFKKIGVVCIPDSTRFTISLRERFIILASDGLSSVMTPEECSEFINKQIVSQLIKNSILLSETSNSDFFQWNKICHYINTQDICTALVKEAINLHCQDNITVILIKFIPQS